MEEVLKQRPTCGQAPSEIYASETKEISVWNQAAHDESQQEIEEMEEIALRSGHSNDGYLEFDYRDIAECFYKAGYRKADEVRKETVKDIAQHMKSLILKFEPNGVEKAILEGLIGWITFGYGVEVDE